MNKPALHNLNIDHEFRNLSPAAPLKYYETLEKDIIASGCREPVQVWNHYIIDGHLRYDICHKQKIPFPISKIHFPSREDAIIWICRKHLQKDFLTEINRRYLTGKYFTAQKAVTLRNYENTNSHRTKPNFRYLAAVAISEQYKLSHHTVFRYGMIASALDLIFQKEPELSHRILLGQIKITFKDMTALSKLSKDKLRSINRYLADNQQERVLYPDILYVLQTKAVTAQRESHTAGVIMPAVRTAIKEMPPYDPDAEISSLTLTIPSWISSIERTRASADLTLISPAARQRIKQQLTHLCNTSVTLLNAVKENE